MKTVVTYLLDGVVQQETHEGGRIVVHIHDDPGPFKRGYVQVGSVGHFYASVVKIERDAA